MFAAVELSELVIGRADTVPFVIVVVYPVGSADSSVTFP